MKTPGQPMSIGAAARQSGVSAKMIRYYEQTGLIQPASRTPSGYRAYSQADVHVLHFIRRARELGFSVSEINELLGLWRDRSRRSADVKRIAQARIAELRQRIESLKQMADTLQTLISCCAGDERPDCPILADLETPHPDAHDAGPRTLAVAPRAHARAAEARRTRSR